MRIAAVVIVCLVRHGVDLADGWMGCSGRLGWLVGEVGCLGRMRSLARRESYDACYACAFFASTF